MEGKTATIVIAKYFAKKPLRLARMKGSYKTGKEIGPGIASWRGAGYGFSVFQVTGFAAT